MKNSFLKILFALLFISSYEMWFHSFEHTTQGEEEQCELIIHSNLVILDHSTSFEINDRQIFETIQYELLPESALLKSEKFPYKNKAPPVSNS